MEEGNLPFPSCSKVIRGIFHNYLKCRISCICICCTCRSPSHWYYIICKDSSDCLSSLFCRVALRELLEKHKERRQQWQQRKIVKAVRDIILTLNSTAQSIKKKSLKQRFLHPKTTCVSTPLSKPLTNPPGELSALINSNVASFFFSFLQSQRCRIKSKVMKSSGVCWAITYALVIWLSCLWATCCATLPGLWNIKWIIAIDRQPICHYVKLGSGADGHSAS